MHMCSASTRTATTAGLQRPLDRLGDLRRHRLLRLQPARIDLDDAGELRQADHAAARVVADMDLADEGHHVVLAMRIERDVADEDHVLVAVDLLEDALEHVARVLAIALVELAIGLGDALRRIEQALPRRIVARPADQRGARPSSASTCVGCLTMNLSAEGLRARSTDKDLTTIIHVEPPVSVCAGLCGRQVRQVRPLVQRHDALSLRAHRHSILVAKAGNSRPRPGQPMLNDVYNKRILELAGNIPLLERLPAPDATATAHSRLCGSTVTIDLTMDEDVVTGFGHDVRACALGQASSSIMARHVVGSTASELREVREQARAILKEGASPAGNGPISRCSCRCATSRRATPRPC
jgi:NifU-like protein involved in Fe-S cluster formation